MKRATLNALLAAALAMGLEATAAELDYRLAPQQVAADTWVLVGKTEDFSTANGGNIVNTGFIATPAGVLVVDTGPSLAYGRQMRAAIARLTGQPVVEAVNTHLHPDHYFGNQAFADVPVLALPETVKGEREEGGGFADNLYRMSGDWMKDTEPRPASASDVPAALSLGGHTIEFLRLAGHTDADLAVFDRTTGTLFTGDLVFHDRTPTTPHAHIRQWLQSLDRLEALPFKRLVPGHGQPSSDAGPIRQTRDYLAWLDTTLRKAAREGRDMAEMLDEPIPERFGRMALLRREFQRSLSHLFPRYEREALEGRQP